jgi:uncharacterized protein with NRDE domain
VCTAIITKNWSHDYPIIVGFNRDHLYSRGGFAPRWFGGRVPFFAPLDPISGGTWLGLNAAGLIVGTVNRRGVSRPEHRLSRGQLISEALGTCETLDKLEQFFLSKNMTEYSGTSLFGLSAEGGFVLCWTRHRKLKRIRPGCTILTEGGLNVRCRRASHIRRTLASCKHRTEEILKVVHASLCEHASSQRRAYTTCCHGPKSGTISSQVILLPKTKRVPLFFYADGAPCNTPFEYTAL